MSTLTTFLPQIIGPLFLLALGFFVGRSKERTHFKQIEIQEANLAHIKALSLKRLPDDLDAGASLVTGNVVVAVDYFKKLMAMIRMVFGGRLRSYDSLMERARREVLLRVKQQAHDRGADAIYNLRFEYSTIGQQPRISGVEILAYGTAVKYKVNGDDTV